MRIRKCEREKEIDKKLRRKEIDGKSERENSNGIERERKWRQNRNDTERKRKEKDRKKDVRKWSRAPPSSCIRLERTFVDPIGKESKQKVFSLSSEDVEWNWETRKGGARPGTSSTIQMIGNYRVEKTS